MSEGQPARAIQRTPQSRSGSALGGAPRLGLGPRLVLALALALGAAAPVAGAQERERSAALPSPQLFEALKACQAIAANVERLACFDAASASLSAAVETKQIVVIEEKEVQKTKRSLFGFSLPDLSIFSGNETDSEADKTLATTIKSLGRAQGGRWNIGTAEGAVWQTTEALAINPAVGDAVEIRAGVMGSYFLRVRNKRAVRAKRVQ